MTRPKRIDYPGAWHHVMNRGIAHRSAFESACDIRFFLSLLAREVRRGVLEVHCFCVLSTHFHLLVRSPKGELSQAMRRIESRYVRWFNPHADRDGALFRGRFRSILVECEFYLRVLVRYIGQNPVEAGIVPKPELFEFGSARCWHKNRFPIWLETNWIASVLRRHSGSGTFFSQVSYGEIFGVALSDEHSEWVSRRTESPGSEDPIAALFGAAPAHVRRWLSERARIADGSWPVIQVVGPVSALRVVGENTQRIDAVELDKGRLRPMALVQTAILRDLCALSLREVAARMSTTVATVRNRHEHHRKLLRSNHQYLEVMADVVAGAIRAFAEGEGR
jgi:REP element-mobilizing transposase RayT/DNA-binding transcriptional regulator YiaG